MLELAVLVPPLAFATGVTLTGWYLLCRTVDKLNGSVRKKQELVATEKGLMIRSVPYRHKLGDEINNDDFWDHMEDLKSQSFKGFANGQVLFRGGRPKSSRKRVLNKTTETRFTPERLVQVVGADGTLSIRKEAVAKESPSPEEEFSGAVREVGKSCTKAATDSLTRLNVMMMKSEFNLAGDHKALVESASVNAHHWCPRTQHLFKVRNEQ